MSNEDIIKLAEEVYREHPSNPIDKPEWDYNRDIHCFKKRKAYVKGFKACQELQPYSVKEMIEFANWYRETDTGENAEQFANFTDKDMLIYWESQKR